MHADLRARAVRPRGRVRRTPVRALVRQTEAEEVDQQERRHHAGGRARRPVAGAEHPDHRQVRVRGAARVAGHEASGRGRLQRRRGRQAPGLRRRAGHRQPVREPVRRNHIVPGVPGRPGGRARGVGVRVEQEETPSRDGQVPGRPVRQHERAGRADGQHVQVVRDGVRETVLERKKKWGGDRLKRSATFNKTVCHDSFFFFFLNL